jgi:hypothetical protein
MTAIQLNRYFEMIYRRVPIKVSGFIRWLRKPSSFAVRLVVAFLLILGGIFSFLPLLGIWMLPLGLMLIAQDVPFLQKPLVQSLAWVEAKMKWLKEKRYGRNSFGCNNALVVRRVASVGKIANEDCHARTEGPRIAARARC